MADIELPKRQGFEDKRRIAIAHRRRNYDEAEARIDAALRSFSLFRTVKLVSLHHLAMLRHAQRRWPESAALCRAILRQKLGSVQNLSRPSRLMLADAQLEMGDLAGTYETISTLYRERLTLAEALNLLVLQVDYLTRIEAWSEMLQSLPTRVQLAELLPSPSAARTLALLAVAAYRTGRTEAAQWLRRRAEMLGDVQQLVAERPILDKLWSSNPIDMEVAAS